MTVKRGKTRQSPDKFYRDGVLVATHYRGKLDSRIMFESCSLTFGELQYIYQAIEL